MTDQCRCPCSDHTPNPIGTPLAGHPVGHWAALPDTQLVLDSENTEHELKQCECGCNVYQGTSRIGPTDVDSLDIPVLPLQVHYVDDDDASDDHEYVSVKITELADMVSTIRSCTCQDS